MKHRSLVPALIALLCTTAPAALRAQAHPPSGAAHHGAAARPVASPATPTNTSLYVLQPASISPAVAGLSAQFRAPRAARPFGDGRYATLRTAPPGSPAALPPPPDGDIVLVITNHGARPVSVRSDSDDGGHWDLALHGPGAMSAPGAGTAIENALIGRWQAIAPGASIEIPLTVLTAGSRQSPVHWYWTTPGAYTLDVTLHAHIAEGSLAMPTDVRGSPVSFSATGVPITVGMP
jgi:hypothetical protein